MLASTMNMVWSVLTIVAQALTVVFIAAHFVPKLRQSSLVRFFQEKGLLVAFVVSLLAVVGSLIYSDVIGYEPCKLCWFQRIFMYPQVILMGLALWRRDQWMKVYGFILSVVGALVAAFHYTGQLGLTPLPCSAVGYSASCAERFVMEFGYITIPMMALSAFLLIAAALSLSVKFRSSAPLAD